MAKFVRPNKFTPLIGLFYSMAPVFAATPAVDSQSALELLSRGDRKAALAVARKERNIILRQFVLAENFQKFQDARALFQSEYWTECLERLKTVSLADELNLDILELRGICEFQKNLMEAAATTAAQILDLDPPNAAGRILMARTALERKQYQVAISLLKELSTKGLASDQLEAVALLRARALNASGSTAVAIQVLQEDHEKNLEHLESIFRLAEIYDHIENKQWNARRYFSLFVTRCHRLPSTDLQKRKLDHLLEAAVKRLAALDANLSVGTVPGLAPSHK